MSEQNTPDGVRIYFFLKKSVTLLCRNAFHYHVTETSLYITRYKERAVSPPPLADRVFSLTVIVEAITVKEKTLNPKSWMFWVGAGSTGRRVGRREEKNKQALQKPRAVNNIK